MALDISFPYLDQSINQYKKGQCINAGVKGGKKAKIIAGIKMYPTHQGYQQKYDHTEHED